MRRRRVGLVSEQREGEVSQLVRRGRSQLVRRGRVGSVSEQREGGVSQLVRRGRVGPFSEMSEGEGVS